MEHDFTPVIKDILTRHFATKAEDLFDKSSLLQYINLKTVSATRGSKARSSFANLYAIYVLKVITQNTKGHNSPNCSRDSANYPLAANYRTMV